MIGHLPKIPTTKCRLGFLVINSKDYRGLNPCPMMFEMDILIPWILAQLKWYSVLNSFMGRMCSGKKAGESWLF